MLRTPKTSWPRPRHNWNPSLDVTYLNASGYCQKDAISLGSCRHFGRGSAFALDDASICYRRILQRTPVQGLLGPPMFKAPGQRRQLPLTPGHMLLVDGREWRRGSVDRLVKTFLYFLGSRPLCFSSSLCMRPSEERLAFTAAYDTIISVLRCPVRLPFPTGGATFSSHMPRNAGPAQLPIVRDAAIRLHDYGRRPGKDSALSCIQDCARMQTRLYTPSRIGPRLHFCLCLDRASRFHWSKPSSSGRAGFGFQPLSDYGRELGRRCCRKSCTLHCPSLCDGDWGACYCRSASLPRRACRRGRRRRRRRIAHCRPPRGWRLLFRWHRAGRCCVHRSYGPAVTAGTGGAGTRHRDGAAGRLQVGIVDYIGVRPSLLLLLALPVHVMARLSHLRLACAVHCHFHRLALLRLSKQSEPPLQEPLASSV